MRRVAISLLFCAILSFDVACGSSRTPIISLQAGQTVKEAVDSLPPTGGTILLGIGTWTSGYSAGGFISKPNVTIRGSGVAGYNSTFTAMSGGTIVQGPLAASSGADFLTVRDLGIDAGSAYINANNGGVPTDGLSISNVGQVVGAPQVESPLIENVSCLGYSPTAPAHCMLVENVDHAYLHNVVTVMNCHGLAFKGTNSMIDGVFARGSAIDSVIVKSDDYAPASQDYLTNITIDPLISAGDTKGIYVVGVGAPISDISISEVRVRSPLSWGINVQGNNSTTAVTNLFFADISVDYQGASPSNDYCMQFVLYVSSIQVNNLQCSNLWAGVRAFLPPPSMFKDFTIANSRFANIATNGIETAGQWNVCNTSFASIAWSGILADSGVTTVSGDTFTDIGVSDMYVGGGTFDVLSHLGTCSQSGLTPPQRRPLKPDFTQRPHPVG